MLSLSLVLYACGNAEQLKQTTNDMDSITITTQPSRIKLDSIEPSKIIVQLDYPKLTLYRTQDPDYTNGESYALRMEEKGHEKEVFFMGDNMVRLQGLKIDTARFTEGKFPFLVVSWTANGSHSYGPNGGWLMEFDAVSIWNLNSMEEVFLAFPRLGSSSFEVGEGEDVVSRCAYTYSLNLEPENQAIRIDSIQVLEDVNCNDKPDKKRGVYRYRKTKFELDSLD